MNVPVMLVLGIESRCGALYKGVYIARIVWHLIPIV